VLSSLLTMPIIKASVIQAATAAYGSSNSLELTLEKLERLAALAKERDGSQIALFPEAFVGGYPFGTSFGSVLGNRTRRGREQYLQYNKSAIEVPSDATRRIEAIANKLDIFLLVPVVERDVATLYCTVLFVHPTKGTMGKRRKLVPTAMERLLWGQGDKGTLPLFRESFKTSENVVDVQLGVVICWENYMPLLRTYYYSKGIQLYFAPTMDDNPKWQSSMLHIALEGRCHVLSACQYAQQGDFPADHEFPSNCARNPDEVVFQGGSVIVSPLGEVLAGPLFGEEGVLSADIDLDEQLMGKFDLDSVGHYSRSDILELKVADIPEHRN